MVYLNVRIAMDTKKCGILVILLIPLLYFSAGSKTELCRRVLFTNFFKDSNAIFRRIRGRHNSKN